MVNIAELCDLLARHPEWLLVREHHRPFPIKQNEIEITGTDEKPLFGFIDDVGFHTVRLNKYILDGIDLRVTVSGSFSRNRETITLVPRVAASELRAEIENARLETANDIGRMIAASNEKIKLKKVDLNKDNGRLAQIRFLADDGKPTAAMADVTGTLDTESTFTSALRWLVKLGQSKKQAVDELWLICEKRKAKNAQALLAMLRPAWRSSIRIFEIDRKTDPPSIIELRRLNFSDLWRRKPARLVLPDVAENGYFVEKISAMAPDEIDENRSRNGETLRFNGLPFARVRKVMNREKLWVGVGDEIGTLHEDNWKALDAVLARLRQFRSADTGNPRHKFYRAAAEAWLESILRRNIRSLDANLIISPIYQQFRSSNDKIDLLALRRDGRLVIVEIKTKPDREMVYQAINYWRNIELQRRRGVLAEANLFDGREIADKPAIIYLAAPAWTFHRDFEFFAETVSDEIELWRFELHQDWRRKIRVLARVNYSDRFSGFTRR